jgi:putative transposase
MSELSSQYPRYGYRRIAIFMRRDGHAMSFGRASRMWRDAQLQVPRKRGRKRVSSGRPRPNTPTGANQVWSYDFVFDWCANGQKLKCLTVTDEWTKEGLAIEVDGRIRSTRVIEVLARLVSERGAPIHLRSDNGPEFVSRAILKWMVDEGIESGEIAADADSKTTAVILLGAMRGVMLQWLSDNEIDLIRVRDRVLAIVDQVLTRH